MAADVLTFDISRRRSFRESKGVGAGEIILFSGVRYERTRAEPVDSPPCVSLAEMAPDPVQSGK